LEKDVPYDQKFDAFFVITDTAHFVALRFFAVCPSSEMSQPSTSMPHLYVELVRKAEHGIFGLTRSYYIISIQGTASLLSLKLSPRISQALQISRSRMWRSQDPCTPSSIICPGRFLNG
jgi:hypothetical protein